MIENVHQMFFLSFENDKDSMTCFLRELCLLSSRDAIEKFDVSKALIFFLSNFINDNSSLPHFFAEILFKRKTFERLQL